MKKLAFVLILFLILATLMNGLTQSVSSNYNVANASQNPLEVTSKITLSNSSFCIAVNDETNRVYVSIRGALVVVNGENNQIIGEIQLDKYKLGYGEAVAVNTQTNRIYVSAGLESDRVAVIDGATNLEVAAIDRMATDQSALAVNPVTNRIYISYCTMFQGIYDEVFVYDGETLALIATVDIPGSNTHLNQEKVGVTVNPNTNKVYATWSGEDTVYMIDGNTNSITKTTKSDFAKDTIRVLVNSYTNYVYVGDVTCLKGETLEEVPVPSTFPGHLQAVDPVQNFLYTTGSNTLIRLNGTTHEVIDSLKLPWDISSYDSFAVNPKTSTIYITDHLSDQLYVISARTPSPSPQSTETPLSTSTSSPSPLKTSTPEGTSSLALFNGYLIAVVVVVIITVIIAAVAVFALRKRK